MVPADATSNTTAMSARLAIDRSAAAASSCWASLLASRAAMMKLTKMKGVVESSISGEEITVIYEKGTKAERKLWARIDIRILLVFNKSYDLE